MAFDTAKQSAEGAPVPVRLRVGTAGESMRVVHTGIEQPSGDFHTACRRTLEATMAEIVEPGGMPCIQCVARVSSSSALPAVSRPLEIPR